MIIDQLDAEPDSAIRAATLIVASFGIEYSEQHRAQMDRLSQEYDGYRISENLTHSYRRHLDEAVQNIDRYSPNDCAQPLWREIRRAALEANAR